MCIIFIVPSERRMIRSYSSPILPKFYFVKELSRYKPTALTSLLQKLSMPIRLRLLTSLYSGVRRMLGMGRVANIVKELSRYKPTALTSLLQKLSMPIRLRLLTSLYSGVRRMLGVGRGANISKIPIPPNT